jgi:hypothetical protein
MPAAYLKPFTYDSYLWDTTLVDVERTNTTNLEGALNHNIQSGDIRYPWFFDHILYDRAFQMFPEVPEKLDVGETEELLTDTPIGVCQLGSLLAGPFGLLESAERRKLTPRLDLPLSHCDDPDCNALHIARLSQPDTALSGLVSEMRLMLTKRHGPFSEFSDFGSRIVLDTNWYDDFSLINFPWFLGNAFSELELRKVTEQLIVRGGGELRRRFPVHDSARVVLRGSAGEISGKLSKSQALQIALLGEDSELVAILDDLIENGEIVIPSSEVRKAFDFPREENWSGAFCECCNLGVHVIGRIKAQPLARLKRMILDLYSSESDRKQLAWILGRSKALGNVDSEGLGKELERFMRGHSPAEALKELVLANHEKLTLALQHLRSPHLKLPRFPTEDDVSVQQMLWKLGFQQVRFASRLSVFYRALKEFEVSATKESTDREIWKAGVRSSGANLFPVLEEVLDTVLAFCTWMFLSDPFTENHLYNPKRGRALMSTELSGVISTKDGPVTLKESGENTLFPLAMGFLALKKRIAELLLNPTEYRKPETLMAHYSHDSSLQRFPYKHLRFVFDAPRNDLDAALSFCKKRGHFSNNRQFWR